jgi:hypothetical protein
MLDMPMLGARMNTHNIEELDLDKHIYRIFKLEHVRSWFESGENVLVSPKLWDDPFENFILNSEAILPGGDKVTFAFRNDFFGQCWTTHKASDAMWRIYSDDKKGIRVRTTIRKLLVSLSLWSGEKANFEAHIGKVQYLSAKKLVKFANTAISEPFEANDFARTLLVKRLAFKHEQEVRLLFFSSERRPHPGDKFSYTADPHNVVEQLMVDPRLVVDEAENLKQDLRGWTGFKGPILRSLLYAAPKKMVFRVRGT